jgi:hypothetical protein
VCFDKKGHFVGKNVEKCGAVGCRILEIIIQEFYKIIGDPI